MQNNKMFVFQREENNTIWHYDLRYLDLPASMISIMPLHCHDYFELEIIYGGQCIHVYNDQEALTGRGCAYLLTPLDTHTYRIRTESDSLRMVNFNFDLFSIPQEITEILLAHTGQLSVQLDEKEIETVMQEIHALHDEIEQNKNAPLHELILRTGFLKLILYFLRKCNIFNENMVYDAENTIFKALAFIHLHFRDNITLNDVATHVNFSPNYLGRLFKEHMGMHFNQYLQQLRLEFASNLLKNSNSSIDLISQYAGFHSPSYFIQVFKSRYHMTPRSYQLACQMKAQEPEEM